MTSWNLNFRYKSDGFSLKIKENWQSQITGLCGPSGSGKSTFLEILLGLRKNGTLSGRAEVSGQTLFDTQKSSTVPINLRGFGWVPQDGAIFPHMQVRKNIYFAFPEEKQDRKISDRKVIEVLGLKNLLDRYPHTLSGGEKQRVVLARALLSQRAILLLDEPMSSVDATLKGEVLSYIKLVAKEFPVSMIYVSHDERELERLCQTRLEIKNGLISIS